VIRVVIQTEPASFDENVRKPGQIFLTSRPNPTGSDWGRHRYWKEASEDLYNLYGGICAYTGVWFSKAQTSVSVDHFLPKSCYPHLAYEWSNYRLTTQKINETKGDKVGLIDPFEVCSGWFVLDLPSCLIKSGVHLEPPQKASVDFTIKQLKLNDDDEHVQYRCDVILSYVAGEITQRYMWKKYPYIAHEISRQGMWDDVASMFRRPTA